jgi:cold shock CspA family protein
MSDTYRGKIIFFLNRLGYGFLQSDSLKDDLFIHFSDIIMKDGGFKTVKKDDLVQFEVGKNLAGEPKAINVQVINE